ncbi:MAG: hypothetical protein HZB53_07735 [Chloroflexi bacterium]|nr:hypothetical protein [Chloroflexota bacterium]
MGNRDGSKFCNECGADLSSANRRCSFCNSLNLADQATCANCGARLAPVVDAEPPDLPEEDAPVIAAPLAAPVAESAADETPDWLRTVQISPDPRPAAAEAQTAPTPADELPDWLRALQPASLIQPAEPPLAGEPLDVTDDQFAAIIGDETTTPASNTGAGADVMPIATGELPDWLAQLRQNATPAAPPAGNLTPNTPDELPDWLAAVGSGPSTPTDIAASESEASGLQPGETPDWLRSLAPAQPETPADWSMNDVAVDELPDWLKPVGVAPSPASGEPAAPTTPADAAPAEIMPAEIPSWVEALKPGAIATMSGESIETSGLLAGIRGALPVESVMAAPHTRGGATAPAATVAVTGFDELSAPHAAPMVSIETPVPARKGGGCLRLWLVVVIVFVAAFPFLPLPFVSEARGANIIGRQPTLDFYQTINQISALRPGSLVLLGMDYGAGARGELDPQARATVLHLLQNKQRIAAVSFVADGGQLAQDALNSGSPVATSFTYPYAYGETHINAGFLSGGAAAMRGLAQNGLPAGGRDFRGRPLAGSPLAAGLKSGQAFDLLIVFTDDGAQLKLWVEQVLRDSGKPLLAGVSAAAEPVAAPYYDSGQLKGLLVGSRGAAEYEGYLGRPASAAASLDAISYVVIVLVVVIAGALAARLWSRPAAA